MPEPADRLHVDRADEARADHGRSERGHGGPSTDSSIVSPPSGVASAFSTAGVTRSLTNRTDPSAIANSAPLDAGGPPKPCDDLLIPRLGSRQLPGLPHGSKSAFT